jgi:GTP-binding protein
MAVFLDEAKINIKAGNGGSGIATFFHLKAGGKKVASGGNGGKGGDVIIRASANVTTLYGFKKKVHFKAENGCTGGTNNKAGRDGDDMVIPVPVGTIVKDTKNRLLADLSSEGDEVVLARGGVGGRGNSSFTSQKRRFPAFCEKGEETEESWINLELRLLADVALVGFPNSGKSTIISRISAARPKIADYPFTTLVPQLGVVTFDDEDFVVADIPGVIEGAHDGVGLGHRFLRHITRSAVLVMVLDGQKLLEPDGDKLLRQSYEILRKELKLYDEEVYEKDFIIAVNKTDLIPDNAILEKVRVNLSKNGKDVFLISAATGDGIKDFIAGLYYKVSQSRKDARSLGIKEKKTEKIYTVSGEEMEKRKISIEKTEEGYIVRNKQLERMVAMTDLENEEALDYLMNRLKKMKVGDRLKSLGIDEGSTVIIGKLVFDLVD